jgi:hypothetical protein
MDWQDLTRLTGKDELVVERVRLRRSDVAIEGQFELPPLARLTGDDQVFVAAFVRCHGSIKEMERLFGVSYPTIKNRLNRLAEQLDFVQVQARSTRQDVLEQLERGELTVSQALQILQQGRNDSENP